MITTSMDQYRARPDQAISLINWDPNDKSAFPDGKSQAKKILKSLTARLEALQEVMWAEQKHKLLVILQGMDTAGKDGTIRHVFTGVNPQGVRVAGFKVPTPIELGHDYLWRVHRQTPCSGEIVIFNRSHYEDVLVVRVHELVSRERWSRRYEHINAFEKLLAEEGTTILKFYLHIDLDEQKSRLQARLDDPTKHWKFNVGDLKERALWPDYMAAYEDVLNRTSTLHAPWYIVPSNRKWLRNLVVSTVIVETLEGLAMQFPAPAESLDGVVIN
ncbi:MAG: polyphosphate kinase 2 family protein [Caldilineales bacterium]